MSWLDETYNFLEDYVDITTINSETDLFHEAGIVGDDFHEMIEKFSKNYSIDMSGYLWYFHTDEEGQNLGRFLFKAPNKRVNRIPVTPRILSESIASRKWEITYPKHKSPKYRLDLAFNFFLIILFILFALFQFLFK